MMFENEYCPNCANYIREIESTNSDLRKENAKLRKLAQAAVAAKANQDAGIHTAYHTGIAIDALAKHLEETK